MMYEEENIEPEILKQLKKNPFKTPENYFESIEERVMQKVKQESKKNKASYEGKIILFLKPALAVAASLGILFLLVHYPVNYFSQNEIARAKVTDTVSKDTMDAYSLSFSLVDENSLINTIIDEDKAVKEGINPDEVLAYLSSDMNDIEIYSEIQK
ncbi:MAG: hypothetical protein ACM3P1_03000 [Candidatus Saccharibacteria bacterium]